MEIISLEKQSFYLLLQSVLEEMEQKFEKDEPWVDSETAKKILGVKSSSTMQRLRDHNAIRYSQPQKKIILYFRESLYSYLEAHSNKIS